MPEANMLLTMLVPEFQFGKGIAKSEGHSWQLRCHGKKVEAHLRLFWRATSDLQFKRSESFFFKNSESFF